jgi:Photosynthesis system II assembly factor YCF48
MNRIVWAVSGLVVIAGLVGLTLTHAQADGPNFRAIKLPSDNERVTGVFCSSTTACVISTDAPADAGHLYASDGSKVTGTILTGDAKFAEPLGTIGEVGFVGFIKVGNRLMAQVSGAGGSFVSATGDITKAASWSAAQLGTINGGGGFGLNQQMGLGTKDNRWVYFSLSTIYEATDAPGPGARWMRLWSPPSVPGDFEALHRADPKLCDSDPGARSTPRLMQPAYVAPDLAVIVYPSGARNQHGSGTPGVCVSTDGGKRFSHVEFKGIEDDHGPLGVTCLNASKCFAYGGLDNAPDSAFVYFTADAQKGVNSSWTKAKLPTLREDTKFRSIGFAPDGMNGWLVGWSGSNDTLMFSSTDGGATWTDATSSVRALAPNARLHSVYAFDAAHVWIGGEQNTLLTMGN